jgi:enediyne polyketide synthase
LPEHELELDPRELYGQLLFQGPRFQRLISFRKLQARECIAEIAVERADAFGQFLPQTLGLGDFGARDAALHAVQACLPHRRLLPVAVRRIVPAVLSPGRAFVYARERYAEGDTYVYDLTIRAAQGEAIERWTGLELRAVGEVPPPTRWPPALLVPFLERRFTELTSGLETSVCFMRRNGENADAAIQTALGSRVRIARRHDGRPEAANGIAVSAAHLDDCSIAVARPGIVACDLETIAARPGELWRGMLGSERMALARLIAEAGAVDLDRAATQVWSATECLKKAGLSISEPLKLSAIAEDGWTVLRAGKVVVATLTTNAEPLADPLVIGLLAEDGRT